MSSHSTLSLFHIVYKQSCNFLNNKLVLPHQFDSNESLRAATSSDNARNRSSSHFLITNFPFWFIPFPFELTSHRSCLERSELLTGGGGACQGLSKLLVSQCQAVLVALFCCCCPLVLPCIVCMVPAAALAYCLLHPHLHCVVGLRSCCFGGVPCAMHWMRSR